MITMSKTQTKIETLKAGVTRKRNLQKIDKSKLQ